MAVLKIVYTEEDKSVQLYRDCDIEAICRSWLDHYVDVQETSFVLQLTTAQELVLFTMQALLHTEDCYKQLITNDILFYVGETQCTFENNWRFGKNPDMFPSRTMDVIDLIWDL
jgi:hypothetical protein